MLSFQLKWKWTKKCIIITISQVLYFINKIRIIQAIVASSSFLWNVTELSKYTLPLLKEVINDISATKCQQGYSFICEANNVQACHNSMVDHLELYESEKKLSQPIILAFFIRWVGKVSCLSFWWNKMALYGYHGRSLVA